MNTRYFACIKDVKYTPDNNINSFVNNVVWYDDRYGSYSISDSTSGCYTISYNDYYNPVKYQFDNGRIYKQIGCQKADDSSIILHDAYGRRVDIVECGIKNHFIEIKMEIDDLAQGCIDRLSKKGFKIEILPINFTLDAETNTIANILYQVTLSNSKAIRDSWWACGNCIANNIYEGLMRAMSSIRRYASEFVAMENSIKGNYLLYANNLLQEKLKAEAMGIRRG